MACIESGFTSLVALVVIAIIYFQSVDADVHEHKIVETNYGKVKGIMGKTFFKEKPFYAFKGIPFAKPPIGERRFKVIYKKLVRRTMSASKSI